METVIYFTDNDADFFISVTEHTSVMYGDCINIPYEITFPQENVTVPYTKVWFSGNSKYIEKRETVTVLEKRGTLNLQTLPPGEHEFGLRLEWGHNQFTCQYTFAKRVRISVSGE